MLQNFPIINSKLKKSLNSLPSFENLGVSVQPSVLSRLIFSRSLPRLRLTLSLKDLTANYDGQSIHSGD